MAHNVWATCAAKGATVVERGVLDGLTRAQIEARPVAPDGHALTTRLADGTSVVLGESLVMERLPGLLADLEREVDAVLLACTGAFPELEHTKPLFVPDRMIAFGAAALLGDTGSVGVVCPLPEQRRDTEAKFGRRLPTGARVLTDVCSPYTGTPDDLAESTATSAPVVGVAIVTEEAVAGSAIGATDLRSVESAVRFVIEAAKDYGRGIARFVDADEVRRLQELYGSMSHLRGAGEPASS
ncbi:AroM family protein [Nocardiopsis deserti]|uniref:AroM family protein n=1 Tax=Nocardiopsis deserti TaxID=2605988 RepID=UPI001CC2309A|nr:AroM family protein [Nocardiopsis deserti]